MSWNLAFCCRLGFQETRVVEFYCGIATILGSSWVSLCPPRGKCRLQMRWSLRSSLDLKLWFSWKRSVLVLGITKNAGGYLTGFPPKKPHCLHQRKRNTRHCDLCIGQDFLVVRGRNPIQTRLKQIRAPTGWNPRGSASSGELGPRAHGI